MALAVSLPAWAQEAPIERIGPPPRDGSLFGHLTVRYWLAQDLLHVTQVAGGQPTSELRRFNYGMMELASNYWFGSIRQEQLANIGALFGIGFAFGIGGFTLTVPSGDNAQTLDVNTHWLNIDVLKFRLLGDPEGPSHLVATANYLNFQNGAVQLSNFAGLGLGLEGRMAVGDAGDLFLKTALVPFPVTSTTSALGMAELGSRWYVAPNVALNVGYKGLLSGLTVERDAQVEGSSQAVPVRLTLWDAFHGPVVGTTFTF